MPIKIIHHPTFNEFNFLVQYETVTPSGSFLEEPNCASSPKFMVSYTLTSHEHDTFQNEISFFPQI